jgi:hypothetical protein
VQHRILVPRISTRDRRDKSNFAQELQAEMNQEFLETLNERESHGWYRFGKVRQAWEKYLKDPDDDFGGGISPASGALEGQWRQFHRLMPNAGIP